MESGLPSVTSMANAPDDGVARKNDTMQTPEALTNRANLALLGRFKVPSEPGEVGQAYWNNVLPQPVDVTLRLFRSNGWLVDASWQEIFSQRYRIDDLKVLLRERGLKLSGKKSELTDRLIATDDDGMRALVANAIAWKLSPSIEARVLQYEASEKAAKIAAANAALAALREGRIHEAAEIIVAYERTRVFPRGLGVDWNSQWIVDHLAGDADAIMHANPGILRELPPNDLTRLRPVAALLCLTGENRAKQWLPEGLAGHPRFDVDTTVRMLEFAGSNQMRLQQLRELGYKRIDVLTCGSSCPTCKAMGDQKYPIDAAPELPHPSCTQAYGCRCLYQADIKSRFSDS